jgi:IS605 OrfB family transposase
VSMRTVLVRLDVGTTDAPLLLRTIEAINRACDAIGEAAFRERTTVQRSQRRRHLSWSFRQLRSFVEYKAAAKGVPVVLVDPRNTSRTCPSCGTVDKKNCGDTAPTSAASH